MNLLANASFDLDTNSDGRPDSWTSDSRFTRSTGVVRSGGFAGRHLATNNSGYTISQTVSNLTAGQGYSFSGFVNIPTTTDAFTLKIDVQWLDANNTVLSTKTVKSFSAQTSGWTQATANIVAPTSAARAQVRMVVSSLNATVYVDDFVFQRSSLLANGDFEWDANSDGLPDSWTSNSNFTVNRAVKHGGNFSGRHFSTGNVGYTVSQTVSNLIAGNTYAFAGFVNIPATTDAFTFKLEIQWRNATNTVISTTPIKTYNAATSWWDNPTANVVAPNGTTNAVVRMVVTSLNATVYVDDITLQ